MVRILRFSVMTLLLVACIPQQQGAPGTPEDGAIGDGDVMMQQEQMMDGDGMMEDGDMMDGEGMMEDDMEDAGSMMMEGDDRMMEGGGSMKGGNGTMKDDMEDEDSMMMENKDSSAMHSVPRWSYRQWRVVGALLPRCLVSILPEP
jgi:hypothetical protein